MSVCVYEERARHYALDLPFLGGAVWVANVQGSKDLKETIPGED